MSVTIELRGVSELLARLARLEGLAPVKGIMTAAASDAKAWLAQYPAPIRTNPNRWYERGYGTRWRRKDGSIGGRRTSETLGRRWTIQILDQGFAARVGNNASYGHWVQDRQTQARVHRGRWRTIQDAAEQQGPIIVAKMKAAIEQLLGGR